MPRLITIVDTGVPSMNYDAVGDLTGSFAISYTDFQISVSNWETFQNNSYFNLTISA